MLRFFVCLMVVCGCSLLTGCGGGGGGNPSRVTVVVVPASINLPAGNATTFTATVSGTNNTGVTWRVEEGAAGGSVTSDGRYVAPALAGVYHVVATSKADPSKSGKANVTVPLTLTPSTPTATMTLNESRPFGATLSGANAALTWSVAEGISGGSVTQAGVYTAPGQPGTYHVTITSGTVPPLTATITITVVSGGASGTIE